MTYVKRILWLAAWSFWLWLGFGLYRELPRDLGPVVCKLDFRTDERFWGFLSEGREALSHDYNLAAKGKPSAFRVWDLETGRCLRQFDGPVYSDDYGVGSSTKHGVAVVPRSMRPDLLDLPESHPQEATLLDFQSGKWIDLGVRMSEPGKFHPTKPWCLLRRGSTPEEYVVVDVKTREKIFRWSSRGRVEGNPEAMLGYFVGEDRVAIAVLGTHPAFPRKTGATDVVEVWTVVSAAREPTIIKDVAIHVPIAASETNRFAWPGMGRGDDQGLEVYDENVKRIVLPKTPREIPQHRREGVRPWISHDGKSALMIDEGEPKSVLWAVDTGRVIWESSSAERAHLPWDYDVVAPPDCFVVDEEWSKRKFGNRELTTVAFRRFADGQVEFRHWANVSWGFAEGPNGPVTYVHDRSTQTNEIRLLPFRVNYTLFGLCQTVLALPLVLLWAVLRWRRRKRTLNGSGAQSSPSSTIA